MLPWYRDFCGKVEDIGSERYRITGCWSIEDQDNGMTKLDITELPIGAWTQTFKEQLESIDFSREGRSIHQG